jgi:hypothetical protein
MEDMCWVTEKAGRGGLADHSSSDGEWGGGRARKDVTFYGYDGFHDSMSYLCFVLGASIYYPSRALERASLGTRTVRTVVDVTHR